MSYLHLSKKLRLRNDQLRKKIEKLHFDESFYKLIKSKIYNCVQNNKLKQFHFFAFYTAISISTELK